MLRKMIKKKRIALLFSALLIVGIFLLVGLSPNVAAGEVTRADWEFNDGDPPDTTPDDNTGELPGGYNNYGTFVKTPTYVDNVGFNWWIEFDGGSQWTKGDHIKVDDHWELDMDSSNGFQIMVKLVMYDDSYTYHAIVDKYYYNSGNPTGYTLYLTNDKVRLSVYSGSNGYKCVFSEDPIEKDTDYWITAGWKTFGSVKKLFLSVDESPTPYTFTYANWNYPPGTNNQDLGIGQRISGWGGYMPYHGKIDWVTMVEF